MNLHKIWRVASLHPPDGHGGLACDARAHGLALRVLSIYAAANEWQAPSPNSELAGRPESPVVYNLQAIVCLDCSFCDSLFLKFRLNNIIVCPGGLVV